MRMQLMKTEVIESPITSLLDQLNAPPLDPVILGVANSHLEGQNLQEISEYYNIPVDLISQILDKKEVKSYVDNVFLNQGYMSRLKRIDLINKVVNAKMQEALETDIFTKKDLLDWMKLLNDMEKEVRPKERSGPAVAVQINTYENLMKDLMKED